MKLGPLWCHKGWAYLSQVCGPNFCLVFGLIKTYFIHNMNWKTCHKGPFEYNLHSLSSNLSHATGVCVRLWTIPTLAHKVNAELKSLRGRDGFLAHHASPATEGCLVTVTYSVADESPGSFCQGITFFGIRPPHRLYAASAWLSLWRSLQRGFWSRLYYTVPSWKANAWKIGRGWRDVNRFCFWLVFTWVGQ